MNSQANSNVVANGNENVLVEDEPVTATRAVGGIVTATAINVDSTSEDTEETSNSNGKKAAKRPNKSSLKHKKQVKEKVPKKGQPALNPKLQSVKNLVEAQPTTILQSKLFALAESNLVSLLISKNKELGLAKLSGEDGYVPISVRFDPTLAIRKELDNDQATIDELIGWKEDIATCKKALAERIKRQVERNNKSMDIEHQKQMIHEMITLGAYMAGREKILHGLADSSANDDVLSKGAVINFFESLHWLDKYHTESNKHPLKVLFKGTKAKTRTIVNNVCSEKTKEAKWANLIHTNEREIERNRFFGCIDNATGIDIDNNNNFGNGNNNNVAPATPAPANGDANNNNNINITPNTNLPPPPTNPPITMAMLQYLLNNGHHPFHRIENDKDSANPFNLWKEIELEAQRKELDIRFSFTARANEAEDNIKKSNIRVSDQLLIWMMEVFPTLLSKPFVIAREESRRNRADALLRGNMNKAESHTLAEQVEERLEKDDEHIHIGKSKWKNFVTNEVSTAISKRDNQRKRKNSSRGDSTSSLTNTKNGDNGKKNKHKKHVQFDSTKTTPQPKSNIRNPYKANKKQTPTPNQSKGKHAFRSGGKKQHQQQRRTGGGRGRGQDRNVQGRGGRR